MFCECGTQRKNVSFLVAVMLLALVLICVSVTILCTDVACKNPTHYDAIGQFAQALAEACLSAAEASIPHTCNHHSEARRMGGQRGLRTCARNPCFGVDYGLIMIALESGLLLAACGGPGPAITMPFAN